MPGVASHTSTNTTVTFLRTVSIYEAEQRIFGIQDILSSIPPSNYLYSAGLTVLAEARLARYALTNDERDVDTGMSIIQLAHAILLPFRHFRSDVAQTCSWVANIRETLHR